MAIKNQISKILAEGVYWDLGGDLDEAIKVLQSYKQKYAKVFPTLRLEFDYKYAYSDSERTTICNLVGIRDETRTESKARRAKAKARQDAITARDLEQLELLKQKYEK